MELLFEKDSEGNVTLLSVSTGSSKPYNCNIEILKGRDSYGFNTTMLSGTASLSVFVDETKIEIMNAILKKCTSLVMFNVRNLDEMEFFKRNFEIISVIQYGNPNLAGLYYVITLNNPHKANMDYLSGLETHGAEVIHLLQPTPENERKYTPKRKEAPVRRGGLINRDVAWNVQIADNVQNELEVREVNPHVPFEAQQANELRGIEAAMAGGVRIRLNEDGERVDQDNQELEEAMGYFDEPEV